MFWQSSKRPTAARMRVAILATAALVPGPALLADTWSFEPTVVADEYVFGDVKIVRARDATEDQQYPEWAIAIYVADELRAFYSGLGFEHIAASPDNRIFVGISNSGLPGTAVVVFDRRGNLLLERRHDRDAFDYCERSEILVRKWYDEAEPDVRYDFDDGGGLRRLTVRGCQGELVEIALGP